MTDAAFTPTPFPYQLHGACRAVWDDHRLIADEPGLGKTIQALLAARMWNTNRVTIICPPVLTTNWENETRRTGNLEHQKGELVNIATDRTTKPPTLPDRGYVIASDMTLAARPALQAALTQWRPDLVIVDEAHRFKNPSARRTRTLARLAKATRSRFLLLTGTPIVSTPIDVLPLLMLLGKLEAIAPDVHTFIDTYTRPNYFGDPEPNPATLPQLHALLEQHVWTRRTKTDVLPDLPAKLRTTHHVTLDPVVITAAHADLTDKIDNWLDQHPAPDAEDIATFVGDALPFVAQLRRAAGIAKIPAVTDWATTHLDGAPDSPLIIWTVHRDVTNQIAANLRTERPTARVRIIDGTTSRRDRDDAVTAFQDGHVDVLVAQIIAAGVGLTLTRSDTALFAETDWTPANVVQAEDRIHRIGQHRPVTCTTVIAENTLDARIHATLARTITTLDALTPGSDHHVTTTPVDDTGPRSIIRDLIHERITTRQEHAA